jgi:hypothetical protein
MHCLPTDSKAVEPTDHGTGTLVTVGQNKPFLFISWLSLVFCYSNRKLTEADKQTNKNHRGGVGRPEKIKGSSRERSFISLTRFPQIVLQNYRATSESRCWPWQNPPILLWFSQCTCRYMWMCTQHMCIHMSTSSVMTPNSSTTTRPFTDNSKRFIQVGTWIN